MVNNSQLKKLGQGCFSLTYLWSFKGKNYILKCPLKKGGHFYKKWFSHVQQEVSFLKKYASRQRQIILPKVIEFSDLFLIQKKVDGIPLTKQNYDKLSSQNQKKIVHHLACFFNKLHRQTAQEVSVNIPKTIVSKKCRDFFDKEEKIIYQKYIALLKKNSECVGLPCLCITDLKANHVLYNLTTQKVGLIDFGSIHFDFPESEFILKNPIRSHLSLKMLRDVICRYNTFQRSEIVSLIRIKCFLILYAMKEVYEGYVTISQKEKGRLKKILSDFIAEVEQTFSEH